MFIDDGRNSMSEKLTISPEEFKKRLDRGEVEFVFDLRNEDEFEKWRVEGRTPVETLNIPQADFVGEEEKYLDRFPKGREIVTVCAHGDSSKYSAERLKERGFRALGLEGGMDLWSELYETHKVWDAPEVYQIYRVARGCISYVIISGGEAAVIDAARHTDRMVKVIEDAGARVRYVIDTHLQADHISGGLELARRYGAQYLMHRLDAKDATFEYRAVEDGEVFPLGSSTLRALYTPGHTPGSVSYMLDGKALFTGDTVMETSIGRPDLGGMVVAWSGLLFDTLFKRLAPLGDDIVVFPTHAASIREQDERGVVKTTLGLARRERDLFQIRDQEAFTARIRETLLMSPEEYQDIRKVNLGLTDPDEKKRKELEIGKNLCGMASKK
jgi:glyoxylase-like metal-dependent hydrolase (beta-lactamase superfamily II)